LILIVACGDDAYDNAIRKQHAQAAAAVEASQRSSAEKAAENAAKAQAQRAERLQDALAIENDPPLFRAKTSCIDCSSMTTAGTALLCSLHLRAGRYLPGRLAGNAPRVHGDSGNAEGSPLIGHMRRHEAALPDVIPPVSEVAIQLVADFINQLPTPDGGVGGD
jgi:hypothetical protein